MRKTLALVLFLISFTLAIPAVAQVTYPDSTRFDPLNKGVQYITVDFAATGSDTTIWFGFEAAAGTVVWKGTDVIVTPVVLGTKSASILDQGSTWGRRNVANPRDGDPAFYCEPETLTTSYPVFNYCCQGLLGWTIEALSTAGYCKSYATAAKP